MRIHFPALGIALVLVQALRAEPAELPWVKQVERDSDRGAGRIVDQQTWELRRLCESRHDQSPSARREIERVDEERHRRAVLDKRRPNGAGGTGDRYASVILGQPPAARGVVISPAAAQAAADEQSLAEAKEKLEQSLRAVNAAEGRALRSLRRSLNRQGRAAEFDQRSTAVRERHEELRAGHHGDFQRTRSRILGRP